MYLGIDCNNVIKKDAVRILKELEKMEGKGNAGHVDYLLRVYRANQEKNILDIIYETGSLADSLQSIIYDIEQIKFFVRSNIIYFSPKTPIEGRYGDETKILLEYAAIFIKNPVLCPFNDKDFEKQEKRFNRMADDVLGPRQMLIDRLTTGQDAAMFVDEFYRFLKGEFHPATISREDAPALPDDQAWHVIYVMQEYFGLLNDTFERCCECGRIFNSNEEGGCIDEDSETEDGGSYHVDDYGNYCGDCL